MHRERVAIPSERNVLQLIAGIGVIGAMPAQRIIG
jgi:hypothetical protein